MNIITNLTLFSLLSTLSVYGSEQFDMRCSFKNKERVDGRLFTQNVVVSLNSLEKTFFMIDKTFALREPARIVRYSGIYKQIASGVELIDTNFGKNRVATIEYASFRYLHYFSYVNEQKRYKMECEYIKNNLRPDQNK